MKLVLVILSFGAGLLAALLFWDTSNEWLRQPDGSWNGPIAVFVVVGVTLALVTKPLGAASMPGFGTTPLGRRIFGWVPRPLTFVLTIVLLWSPLALIPGKARYDFLQSLPGPTAEILVLAYLVGMIWLATKLVGPVREWIAILTGPVRRFFRIISFGAGGSARFAGIMEEWRSRYKKGAVLLGSSLYDPKFRVGLKDDRHMLTIGGTRAGKNRSLVIPNLITWPGSALVIDPKGTNAAVTAARRGHGGGNVGSHLGQDVYVLDPFGEVQDTQTAHFNPLDFIDPHSPRVAEDIWLIADALVVASGDDFFDTSALGLISGLIAHVVTRERDTGGANLSRVRELLSRGSEDDWDHLLQEMLENNEAGGLAASAAGQLQSAGPRAGGDIRATAQYHTRWLDSVAMAEVLKSSDFAMSDLKAKSTTVYLVLPPDQLNNHARFLRLFVNLAIQTASTGANPRYPVLFMLDEFFSLGKLDLAERAVALLGSKALKFWPVVQSLTQLKSLYGDNWETFWDAAAAVQVFGIGDQFTEEYIVNRLGLHRVERMRENARGEQEVIEEIHKLRQPEELEFEVAREAGTQLVWRKGGDAMFLRRINYDQAFPGHWYNPDPDFEPGRQAGPNLTVRPAAKPAPQTVPSEPEVPYPGNVRIPKIGPDGKMDILPGDIKADLKKAAETAKIKPILDEDGNRVGREGEEPKAPPPKARKEPKVKPKQRKSDHPAEKKDSGAQDEGDPFDELDGLIGLDAVKEQVGKIIDLVEVQQARKRAGLPIADMSNHLVFTGNPGTGKTTVARIISRIYRELGLLKKGHLVETERAGLVGGHIGQTELKVLEVVESAMDGVLFVDEAYSLSSKSDIDYGARAIEVLLTAMEAHRDRLAVIVAGYTDEMKEFIASNPGLSSRFKTFIEFPDYDPDELCEIFTALCTAQSYTLTPQAARKVETYLSQLYENRDRNFGNGRDVRNLFEDCLGRQASRLAEMDEYSTTDLMILHEEDIPRLPGTTEQETSAEGE